MSDCGLGSIDELKPSGLYIPRNSNPRDRSAIPLSNLEGLSREPWNDSCFDPLTRSFPFETRRVFSQFEGHDPPPPIYSAHAKYGYPGTSTIEDEGFFEYSAHPDCDPHLPSRFSTATTSTSTYIAIDPAPLRSIPKEQFLTLRRILLVLKFSE